MVILYILLCAVLVLFLGGAYYAYRVAFFSPKKDREKLPSLSNPSCDPYREVMRKLFHTLQEHPCEFVTVQSDDGIVLSGRYYHVKDGAPLDIGFHGYRSSALTDFSGGAGLSIRMGHNVLLVDQRAHGKSQGSTITFGIRERYDLVKWVDWAVMRFGPEVKITLYGISMGGATVLMASELELPKNVKGIIADCPYSSPMDIILHVAKSMPIPQWLVKPFVILGARIYGGFDVDEITAEKAVANAKVPILIIHGDADGFVPCEMSDIAAQNPKLVTRHTIAGADHGISYLVDTPRYEKLVQEFMERIL